MGGLKDLKMLESQLKPHGPILHLKFGQLNGWDANRIKKCIELKGGHIGK